MASDLLKLPIAFLGFSFIAVASVLLIKLDFGMHPWGVLQQGLVSVTGLRYGTIFQILGVVTVLFNIVLLRVYPSVGTILNLFSIGILINIYEPLMTFDLPEHLAWKIFFAVLCTALNSLGIATYVQVKLGKGPRDGMFVGLTKKTGISVTFMKPFTEAVVLTIGYFLGGKVGVATFIFILTSGFFVQRFFKLYRYSPKQAVQREFIDYFRKKDNQVQQ